MPAAEVVASLALERLEDDLFRGGQPQSHLPRMFGGQLLGQSLSAAYDTVDPARHVHALQAHFLRPGDTVTPIVLRVQRLLDGRNLAVRQVGVLQNGRLLFTMTATFGSNRPRASAEEDYQETMPDVVPPDALQGFAERLSAFDHELDGFWTRPRPFDLRYVGDPPRLALERPLRAGQAHQVWMRAAGPVPDDRRTQLCMLVYASDLTALDAVMPESRRLAGAPRPAVTSLNHSVWFHRPADVRDWLLYEHRSPSGRGLRGLASGRIFDRSGALVCSVMQEGSLTMPSGDSTTA